MKRRLSKTAALLTFILPVGAVIAAPDNGQRVQPPPRPSGSERVVPNPGLNPTEVQRSIHAHTKPVKDKTRDDTLPSQAPVTR